MSAVIADALSEQLRHAAAAPPEDLLAGATSLWVIAPHPDDESLGGGLLLFEAARRGLPCRVVCVTDGAASHRASRRWPAPRLAAARARELSAAVACVAPSARITRLGLPDGAVPDRGRALDAAREVLRCLIAADRRPLVATTWEGDPHGDHVATSRLVRSAVADLPEARVLQYPIWGRFDSAMPPPAADRITLLRPRAAAVTAKRAAVACHRTQMTRLIDDDPDGFVMDPPMQAHFVDYPEIFFAA